MCEPPTLSLHLLTTSYPLSKSTHLLSLMSQKNSNEFVFPQGAYWLRNASGTYLGLNSDQSRTSAQDKLSPLKSVNDQSQIWLVELLSDGVSYNIRNAGTGRVLDVRASNTADGAHVILYSLNDNKEGTPNQQWGLEWVKDVQRDTSVSYYKVVNKHTQKALSQVDNEPSKPAVSLAWKTSNNDSQLWSFEPIYFPTIVNVVSMDSLLYLDGDVSLPLKTAPKQSATDSSLSQFWYLEYKREGDVYVLRSTLDEQMVLDVAGQNTAEGTEVLMYREHGGPNQRWKVEKLGGTDVRLISTLGNVALTTTPNGKLQITKVNDMSKAQVWRFETVPTPSPFWQTIQNIESGSFITQTGSNTVSPTSPVRVDRKSWWRFVPKPGNGPFFHYDIVNRESGQVLTGGGSLSAGGGGSDTSRWALDCSDTENVGIFNVGTKGVLDHYEGGSKLEAKQRDGGAENPLRQWALAPVEKRVPSFAIVNARTGRFLSFNNSSESGGIITNDDFITADANQWYLYNKSPNSDDTVFAIGTKVSGMVLDHFYERALAAANDNAEHPHHQWRLIPLGSGERYFQIQNVGSQKYLEELNSGSPNANANQPTTDDRSQLWELVSSRPGGKCDLFIASDHIISVLAPALSANNAKSLRRLTDTRANHMELRWPGAKQHTPRDPAFLRDSAPTLKAIFINLIHRWTDDAIFDNVSAGVKISADRALVVDKMGILVPRDLQADWADANWLTIAIQNTYDGGNSGRTLANIVGRCSNGLVVLHVVAPVGVKFGRVVLRQAMMDSMVCGTAVFMEERSGTKVGAPGAGAKGVVGNGLVYPLSAMVGSAGSFWPLGM